MSDPWRLPLEPTAFAGILAFFGATIGAGVMWFTSQRVERNRQRSARDAADKKFLDSQFGGWEDLSQQQQRRIEQLEARVTAQDDQIIQLHARLAEFRRQCDKEVAAWRHLVASLLQHLLGVVTKLRAVGGEADPFLGWERFIAEGGEIPPGWSETIGSGGDC